MARTAVMFCASVTVGFGVPPMAEAAPPDGRVYEMVSPVEKAGNTAGAITGKVLPAVSTPNGERLVFGTSGPVGESQSGIGPAYDVATRNATSGWTARGVLPRPLVEPIEVTADDPFQSFYPSTSLTSFTFATRGPYVGEGDASKGPNLFLSGEDAATPPEWIAKPTIANPVPALGTNGGLKLPAVAGSPSTDGRVYFTYFGTLVPEDASRSAHVEESGRRAWGFYEWNEGRLVSAGRLPNGSYDAYGAVPAASGERGEEDTPDALDNQVSSNGTRAFFVSPDPESAHPSGDPVELYVRKNGERSVLVSRDELAGGAPAPGYPGVSAMPTLARCLGGCSNGSYAYAAPDGSRVFFASKDKLARSRSGEEPSGTGPWTYEFNVATETVKYVPELTGAIVGSSANGSALMYVELTGTNTGQLKVWSEGHVVTVGELVEPANNESNYGELFVAPVRTVDSGTVWTFETDAPVTGALAATGPEAANDVGGYGEVYRLDTQTGTLRCVSCPGPGEAELGDANMSNNDVGRDAEHEPGAGLVSGTRGVNATGSQVYFDTPNALVPTDTNGVRDVYEWETDGVHLISTGTDPRPSFFLDNSESGRDVFFTNAGGLVAADGDSAYDVYDARVGGGFPTPFTLAECTETCQTQPRGPFGPPSPLTAAVGASGNLKTPASRALTKAQKLAKALKQCKKDKSKKKRVACEKTARKKYGKQGVRLAYSRRAHGTTATSRGKRQ